MNATYFVARTPLLRRAASDHLAEQSATSADVRPAVPTSLRKPSLYSSHLPSWKVACDFRLTRHARAFVPSTYAERSGKIRGSDLSCLPRSFGLNAAICGGLRAFNRVDNSRSCVNENHGHNIAEVALVQPLGASVASFCLPPFTLGSSPSRLSGEACIGGLTVLTTIFCPQSISVVFRAGCPWILESHARPVLSIVQFMALS